MLITLISFLYVAGASITVVAIIRYLMIIASYLLKYLPSYPPHGGNYRTIFLLWLRLQAARWLWNSFEICSEFFKSVTAIEQMTSMTRQGGASEWRVHSQ